MYMRIRMILANELCDSELANVYAYAYTHGMTSELTTAALVARILEESGWSQVRLAEECDTTQSSVSRWLDGSEPSGSTLERLKELAFSLGILESARSGQTKVALVGLIGAGAVIDTAHADDNGDEWVDLPFSLPDELIAFEVVGESMLPVYESGEIVVCLRNQVRATDDYVGKRAAVRTADGARYIKRIMRGPRKGRYDLESWNARTMENVQIAWVGEIVATIPPWSVRRLARKESK